MKHKLIPFEELGVAVASLRKQPGLKIVLTNGCFDMLHPGHIFGLTYARSLGDVLIVLVNSDDYVQKTKGPDRPYYDLKNRLFMVGSLDPVSVVSPLRSSDVVEALTLIKPDIWVKGEDYTLQKLNQAERQVAERLGIQIVFSPLLPGVSTSNIVETIKTQAVLNYKKESDLEGGDVNINDVEKSLPPEFSKHFKKIITGTVAGKSETYENKHEVFAMPPLNCSHRKEEIITNKHCGCKKKRLFCNLFNKQVSLRDCAVCNSRSA